MVVDVDVEKVAICPKQSVNEIAELMLSLSDNGNKYVQVQMSTGILLAMNGRVKWLRL